MRSRMRNGGGAARLDTRVQKQVTIGSIHSAAFSLPPKILSFSEWIARRYRQYHGQEHPNFWPDVVNIPILDVVLLALLAFDYRSPNSES